jgi:hypothetical protein
MYLMRLLNIYLIPNIILCCIEVILKLIVVDENKFFKNFDAIDIS